MTAPSTKAKRPLSPHVSIYRWQISNTLSILNRITGMALYIGAPLLVLWLWSAAYAPEFYGTLHGFLASLIGQALLLGWLAAFNYHLVCGIRHLVWDTGHGLKVPSVNKSGILSVIATLVLTAFVWGVAISSGGAQ